MLGVLPGVWRGAFRSARQSEWKVLAMPADQSAPEGRPGQRRAWHASTSSEGRQLPTWKERAEATHTKAMAARLQRQGEGQGWLAMAPDRPPAGGSGTNSVNPVHTVGAHHVTESKFRPLQGDRSAGGLSQHGGEPGSRCSSDGIWGDARSHRLCKADVDFPAGLSDTSVRSSPSGAPAPWGR